MNRRDLLNSWPFGLLLTGLFFLTHAFGLDKNDLWIDEFITWGSAQYPFAYMIEERLSNGHMPGYFIIVRLWCDLFGWSVQSMRMISVVFASVAFLGFFALVRTYLRPGPLRWIALALFFFHPWVLWASQEARMYAGMFCLTILACLAYLRFLRTGRWSDLGLYLLAGALGVSLHMMFALQFLPHVLYAVIFHRPRTMRVLAALGVIAIGVLLAFSEVSPKTESKKRKEAVYLTGAWNAIHATAELGVGRTDSELFEQRAIKKREERNYFLFLGLVGIFVFNAWLALEARQRSATRNDDSTDEAVQDDYAFWRFIFFWFAAQLILMIIIGLFFSRGLGQIRYHTGTLPPLLLLISLGFYHNFRNWFMQAARVVLIAVMALQVYRHIVWDGPGVRDVLETIVKEYEPGDGLILCHNGALMEALDVYDIKHIPFLGVGKTLLSESVLLNQIEAFSKDKNRIWMLLYRTKNSPLDDLLNDQGRNYERLRKERVREVKYHLYRVKDPVHASTATLSRGLGFRTVVPSQARLALGLTAGADSESESEIESE